MTTLMLPLVASRCLGQARREPAAVPDGIRRAVEARAGRRVRDLRVEWVGASGVVLHGWADSYHAKQLAQHVVGQASGRAVLANRIEVRLPPAPPATWPTAAFQRPERAVPTVSF